METFTRQEKLSVFRAAQIDEQLYAFMAAKLLSIADIALMIRLQLTEIVRENIDIGHREYICVLLLIDLEKHHLFIQNNIEFLFKYVHVTKNRDSIDCAKITPKTIMLFGNGQLLDLFPNSYRHKICMELASVYMQINHIESGGLH